MYIQVKARGFNHQPKRYITMGISTKGINSTAKITVTKAGLAYNPKANSAQGNAATWATIQTALKKPQTVASLTATVKAQHNHAPFVGYCIRRGWLKTA